MDVNSGDSDKHNSADEKGDIYWMVLTSNSELTFGYMYYLRPNS